MTTLTIVYSPNFNTAMSPDRILAKTHISAINHDQFDADELHCTLAHTMTTV